MTTNSLTTIDQVRQDLTNMGRDFSTVLPSNISLEKFTNVAITAIQNSPDILLADRQSLYASCYKAAKDGLLPDNKEAALVIFNANIGTQDAPKWIKKVQYMPMVEGIKKKIYSTKLTETIMAAIVYEHELSDFTYYVDEKGQHLSHKPKVFGDRGKPVGAYAMTTMKETKELCIEFINMEEIDKIRNSSKSKNGTVWTNWWTEMAKKSAIRRLAKRLPQNEELRSVIEQDNESYEGNRVAELSHQETLPSPIASGLTTLKNKVIEGTSKQVPTPTPKAEPAPPAYFDEEELF